MDGMFMMEVYLEEVRYMVMRAGNTPGHSRVGSKAVLTDG